jgi:cholesterol transport system auxiliary component
MAARLQTQSDISGKMKSGSVSATVFAMIAILAGCSSLGGSNKALDTYDLVVPAVEKVGKRKSDVQILIAEPQALKIIDSESIVLRNGQSSVAYLGGAQWSDRLPKMVQARLIQAFENSNRFGGVGRPGEGLAIDYQIITDIRSFEIDSTGSDKAVIEISAKLLNDRNGVVGSSKLFMASVPATQGASGYVSALDAAFDSVAGEIVGWASSNI